jgi:ferredoxin
MYSFLLNIISIPSTPLLLSSSSKQAAEKNLGIGLGPIALSFSEDKPNKGNPRASSKNGDKSSSGGVDLGPIALSFSEDGGSGRGAAAGVDPSEPDSRGESISSISTDEWRQRYENSDGSVSLWVEEEFNAGSRLVGGRAVHQGRLAGLMSGEGPSLGEAAVHTVRITNHYQDGQTFEVQVPEDRYILFEAEDKGLELPWACRMGCCTACAVRVVEGEVYQPQALGISRELKEQGFALMCVGYPMSDCVMETVSEDEVYDLQFGESFAQRALDPSNPAYVQRDDFALEVALGDE